MQPFTEKQLEALRDLGVAIKIKNIETHENGVLNVDILCEIIEPEKTNLSMDEYTDEIERILKNEDEHTYIQTHIDEGIRADVDALNAVYGVKTIYSCEGHPWGRYITFRMPKRHIHAVCKVLKGMNWIRHYSIKNLPDDELEVTISEIEDDVTYMTQSGADAPIFSKNNLEDQMMVIAATKNKYFHIYDPHRVAFRDSYIHTEVDT